MGRRASKKNKIKNKNKMNMPKGVSEPHYLKVAEKNLKFLKR